MDESRYVFKPKSELLWFMAVAIVTVLMQALVEFDPHEIRDIEVWAIGIGAAMVRAGAGAFLTYVAKRGVVYNGDGSDS